MEKSRRNWTKEETKALLLAYSARKAEFEDRKKRKFAMANVLEDLVAQGILKEPTNVDALNTKIKNLLRAYKASKDTNKKTGSAPNFAPFESLMDEIFGDRPIISNTHCLGICSEPAQALPNVEESQNVNEEERASTSTSMESVNLAPIVAKNKRKKSPREVYYERKLELKREMMEKKLQQQQEEKERAEAAKERRHKEKLDVLKSLINK